MTTPQDKTILVVDDEPDVVLFLETALSDAGFRVLTASNGEEALAHVQAGPVDFISLDLVMPKKSGIRFLHELRRNPAWAKIPVLILTGHAKEHADELQGLAGAASLVGPKLYLEKPIRAPEFVAAVAAALGVTVPEAATDADLEALRAQVCAAAARAERDPLREALRILTGRS